MTDPLKVRCPTCGARVGESCELATGQLRAYAHRERLLTEEELKEQIHRLRVELKTIAEWDRSARLLRTQTETDALVLRAIRRHEIESLLLEIVQK